MKYTTIIIAGLLSMFLVLSSCQEAEPRMEAISVEGNKFVNASGETLVFKGVNIRDPHNLEEEGHWTKAHLQEARDWGANIIRLPIHPVSWRARGEDAYMELIDQAVEWARDLELYLILDWHSIGNLKEEKFQNGMYVTNMEETSRFWDVVSDRFADEPVVAMYEIFNEPTVSGENFGECSWEDWKAINEDLIRVIRANDPKSVILVAGFNWAYDLTPVKNSPVNAEGIAYVSHPYPMKRPEPWVEDWQADFGYVAEKYPVILTEIGFALPDEKGAHIPVKGDERYGETLDSFTAERGISWVVWCFDPDWSPFMFTDWDYTPTRQGAFYKKVLGER